MKKHLLYLLPALFLAGCSQELAIAPPRRSRGGGNA